MFSLNGGKSSSHKSLPVRFYENYIWLVGFTCSLSIISRILRCPRSWQVPCKCKECFHDTLAIDIYTDTSEKQPDESIKTLPVFCCNTYVLHNSLVNWNPAGTAILRHKINNCSHVSLPESPESRPCRQHFSQLLGFSIVHRPALQPEATQHDKSDNQTHSKHRGGFFSLTSSHHLGNM